MTHTARLFAACLLLLLPLAIVASAAAQEEAGREKGAAGEKADPGARLAPRMWWNNAEVAAALKLSDAQRAKLDARLAAYAEQHAGYRQRQKDAFKLFSEALASGDEAVADAQKREMGAASGAIAVAQAGMMQDVVGQLSAEQKKLLGETYPRLLRRMWIMQPGTGGGKGRRVEMGQVKVGGAGG